MSAKLQVPHVLTRAMGSAQAVYFDSGEHRLFAWLHRSPDIRQADLGVVICKPFGYEAICAHRGMRAFAEAIAAAGMPALRFDYLGTGDSAEIDPEADQIEAWTLDVLAAVEELKLRTGVRDVCLLGFRLGALLAARATSESESVSGLISIAPITAGRRYLRELRTTRMAGALGLGPDETVDKTASPGGMEVSGFSLSAATIASLGKLDSSTLPSPIALPTLVIGAATMPVSGGPAHSAEAQGRTALPGLVEMLMTPPQFALVPKEIISATVEWLLQLPAQAPACPVRSTGEPLGGLESSGLPDQLTLAATPTGPQVVRTERPAAG
jgi:pimeloyl-ACP methyl ester carboxylesterase